MKTNIFHEIKYDLKGHTRSHIAFFELHISLDFSLLLKFPILSYVNTNIIKTIFPTNFKFGNSVLGCFFLQSKICIKLL